MGCLLTVVNNACRRANAYVEGDAKMRRQIIQKNSVASPSKARGKRGTLRVKESRRAAMCARTVWVMLHMALISLAFLYGTELKVAWANRYVGYLAGLCGLLISNVALYATASLMDPGFQSHLPESEGDLPWPKGRRSTLEDLADPTVGRDSDWLLQNKCSSRLENCRDPLAAGSTGAEEQSSSGHRVARSRSSAAPPANGQSQQEASTNGVAPGGKGVTGDAVVVDVREGGLSGAQGRVCSYCSAWQPLRTKHCHDCDRCVRLFDHHCVWLGNCVGVRNYRVFFLYLITQTACLVWGLKIFLSGFQGIGAVAPRIRPSGLVRPALDVWVELHLPLLAGVGAMFLLVLLVASLLIYHTYLLLTNQTSYELLKQGSRALYYTKDLPYGAVPFSKGPVANCKAFLCQGGDWGENNVMPPLSELQALATKETFWNNRHYSCFD